MWISGDCAQVQWYCSCWLPEIDTIICIEPAALWMACQMFARELSKGNFWINYIVNIVETKYALCETSGMPHICDESDQRNLQTMVLFLGVAGYTCNFFMASDCMNSESKCLLVMGILCSAHCCHHSAMILLKVCWFEYAGYEEELVVCMGANAVVLHVKSMRQTSTINMYWVV